MSDRDYYETLGVAREADPATIKSAYRKLAMKWHPDQNPGNPEAEARFKEINEAYAVLSDADKRAQYDRFGKAAFSQGQPSNGDFEDLFAQVFGDVGGVFGDLFGQAGGRSRRGGPQRGADLRYDLEITLEEAFAGKSVAITAPTTMTCEACAGAGAAPGAKPAVCAMCDGVGMVRAQQGFFTMQRTCPQCGGRGQIIKDPCKSCGGRGVTRKDRTLSVDIPAGVEDGTRIRLSGEGEAGPRNGPRGDLYLFLSLKPHALFERDGANLLCRTPVSMTMAALGGDVEIPTIEGGKARVKIPEGAQSGARVRLAGKGMSRLRASQRGDLFVELRVETPVKLSAKQRRILEEFQKTECEFSQPNTHGFLKKVRSLFDSADRPAG
jgi:molecular chaperone DnaJ